MIMCTLVCSIILSTVGHWTPGFTPCPCPSTPCSHISVLPNCLFMQALNSKRQALIIFQTS